MESPPSAGGPAAEPEGIAKPYGLLGLCISLAFILLLTSLFTALIAAGAYGGVFGWSALIAQLQNLAHPGVPALTGPSLDQPVMQFSLSLIVYFSLGLAILVLARFRGGPAWRQLIALRPWSLLHAGKTYWLIAAGALVYGLISSGLVAYFNPDSRTSLSVPHDGFASGVLLFILAVVFAPVAEELFFRGWIYTSLRPRLGIWPSLLISAAIFAGLHYDRTHLIALAVFPVGLALGAMREKTGSLLASISFHAFYNALAYCLAIMDHG